MDKATDVAIVGGGVIGCAIAYYLARHGIRSTVFEQSRFASGASGATAGLVSPLWHVDHTHRALFSLGLRSLEIFPELSAELIESGIDPLFRSCGILKFAITLEEAETLRKDLAWQGELGLDVSWEEPGAVFEREREINPAVLGGVFSPYEGHVCGQRLVDALVHASSKLGARFFECVEAIGLKTEGRRVRGGADGKGLLLCGPHGVGRGPLDGYYRSMDSRAPACPTCQGAARAAAEDRVSP